MPGCTSCSSESRSHRGSEWGMPCLEPSPRLWLLTYLRGHLPSTFSVEAGALPSSTQHRSQPINRNAKFVSSARLSSWVDHRYQRNDRQCVTKDTPSSLVFDRFRMRDLGEKGISFPGRSRPRMPTNRGEGPQELSKLK